MRIINKEARLKGGKLGFVFALGANILRMNDLIFNLKQYFSLQWNKIYFNEGKQGRLLVLCIYEMQKYQQDLIRYYNKILTCYLSQPKF